MHVCYFLCSAQLMALVCERHVSNAHEIRISDGAVLWVFHKQLEHLVAHFRSNGNEKALILWQEEGEGGGEFIHALSERIKVISFFFFFFFGKKEQTFRQVRAGQARLEVLARQQRRHESHQRVRFQRR